MIIPLAIAEKLYLLSLGEQMPASKLKHAIIKELQDEGIIIERITGRTKSTLYIADGSAFNNYLHNKWSVPDLKEYIEALKREDITRSDLIQASNDSKTIATRTFKGFLVNSYLPILSTLNGAPFTICPPHGTFQFIHGFEHFLPAEDVIIAGVENTENFRRIADMRHLFADKSILFACRYPQGQGRDFIKWLQSIPNEYLHLGDYDFAGINIYMQEYKKHLSERASFFIPAHIEQLIEKYGSRKLYDQQQLHAANITEAKLQQLISLIHKYKKGLEQEALLIA